MSDKSKIKHVFFLFLIAVAPLVMLAQSDQINSLQKLVRNSADDTLKVNALIELSSNYYRTAPAEAIKYGSQARDLAQELEFTSGLAYALKSIGMGYYFQGNYIEGVIYWQQALETFTTLGDKSGMSNMLNNLGAVYFNGGDDDKAIEYYLESLRVSEEVGDTLRIATALVNIGAVYNNKPATFDKALEYYRKALPLGETLGNYDAIGTCAVNMGGIYIEKGDYQSALFYLEKALDAYRQSETGNVPYALNSLGKVYMKRGEFDKAIEYQKQAYQMAEEFSTKLEMTQASLGLANTYEEMGNTKLAVETYKQAEQMAGELGASYELKNAYQGLANSYSMLADYKNAYAYQTLLSDIKDTLYNSEMDKRIQALTLNFDIEKQKGQIDLLTKDKALKELDLRRQKIIRTAAGITGILLFLLAGGLFNRYKYVRKTNRIIEEEKDRSEKLLLNILPHETAEELKTKGSATPKHYDKVSVLFTDFKGFTKIAEKLTPQQLVEELNHCFVEFDRIIDKYNLEKIKTIGDAYMCAGGIPVENDTNPIDIVKAGMEIRMYMENLKAEREAEGKDYWELRIGIHTGPVIAGVVGKNKFAYDIWGDAVNTASRMESSGIPGKVNISGTTYELVKDHFVCTYRGKVHAKNKGDIDMYIVEQLSGENGIKTNPLLVRMGNNGN